MHEIHEKFLHEFACELAHEFVHEFMRKYCIFKERIWGKSISIINIVVIFPCVRFYLHGQTLRYVDIIKGSILFEII